MKSIIDTVNELAESLKRYNSLEIIDVSDPMGERDLVTHLNTIPTLTKRLNEVVDLLIYQISCARDLLYTGDPVEYHVGFRLLQVLVKVKHALVKGEDE